MVPKRDPIEKELEQLQVESPQGPDRGRRKTLVDIEFKGQHDHTRQADIIGDSSVVKKFVSIWVSARPM